MADNRVGVELALNCAKGVGIENAPRVWGHFLCVFGGVLLFHPGWVVSSALAGLASGFGMGPGVSLSLCSP